MSIREVRIWCEICCEVNILSESELKHIIAVRGNGLCSCCEYVFIRPEQVQEILEALGQFEEIKKVRCLLGASIDFK